MDGDRVAGIIFLVCVVPLLVAAGRGLVVDARRYGTRAAMRRPRRLPFGRRRTVSGLTVSLYALAALAGCVVAVGLIVSPRRTIMITVTGKYSRLSRTGQTTTYEIRTAHDTWFAPNAGTYRMMHAGDSYRCTTTAFIHDRDLSHCRPARQS